MKLLRYVLVAALAAAPALTFAQPAPAQAKRSIAQREFNQKRRIGNGIRNRALTPRQGVRLERQQMRMHRQIRTVRARHNGRLTMRERRIINRRQNIASRRIYHAKHLHRVG